MPEATYAVWHPFTAMPPYSALTPERLHTDLLFIERAQGAWVQDERGSWYLNLLNAINAVGFGRQSVLEAIERQYRQLTFHPLFAHGHRPAEALAARLLGHAPSSMRMVFFANDGSGAVETALKLARFYFMVQGRPERRHLISLEGAYHGVSYGALSVTHMDMHSLFAPVVPDCHAVPAPHPFRPPIQAPPDEVVAWCVSQLERKIDEIGADKVAAVVVEPVQGVRGCVVLPDDYFRQVRSLTRRHGILLIADEVSTGLGRTGQWFASAEWEPDMIAVSKGLTSGYFPLGATLVSGLIYEAVQGMGFPHGSTTAGHPVGCAAAQAVIDIIEQESLVENAARVGAFLLDGLRTHLKAHPHVGDVRGRGMMLAVEFVQDRESKEPPNGDLRRRIMLALRAQGLLTAYFEGAVTLYPPLSLTQAEASELVGRFAAAAESLLS